MRRKAAVLISHATLDPNMPIPKLNRYGVLPVGVHDCTLKEIQKRFGRFGQTDRRVQLMERLEQYAGDLRHTALATALIVDGSFVTAEPYPNDIDLIVVLPKHHDFATELLPMDYNVLSRRRVRARYKFDVFVDRQGSPEYKKHLTFFHGLRDLPGVQKGVLKVRL